MKTQSVSYQPNFTAGEIKFIRTVHPDGSINDLKEVVMPKIDGFILSSMKKIIDKRPYDLYISESKDISGYYAVDANVDFANIIGNDIAKQGKTSVVYFERLERFISASREACESFEQAKDYKELIKRKSLIKMFLKNLFKKDNA